jgi:ATP-binding cassette, subfamily B, bacterial
VKRLWELIAIGFRAAPELSASVWILGAVGALASVSYTLGFRITIDAATNHDAHEIVLGVILIAVLFTLGWLATILSASRGSVLTDKVSLYLGMRIGRLAGALPGLEHFERPADLAQIDQLRTNRRGLAAAPQRMLNIFQVGLRSLAIVVLLATIYPPILIVPVFALAPFLANRRAGTLQRRADDELAEPRRLLDELFAIATNPQGARELRTHGVANAVAERHVTLGDDIRGRALRAQLAASAWEAAGWLAFAVAFAAAILALVLRAAHGHASPGGVVMAVSLMRRAQTQVTRGADGAVSLGATLRTADQLRWLEEQAAAPAASVTGEVPERLSDGIRLRDVAFAYPSGGRDVIDGIDLHLPAGSIVALLGDNGAGKTTLVKLLTGMYRPTTGAIELDGVDLNGLALDRWRARTTATFQDYQRLQFIVQQSIGAGDLPRIDDEAAAREALARAGGETLLDALPQGLHTPLGRTLARGRELSGGQWQRIALARGLMRPDPLLVILDEPTASVDAPTERALFERYAAAARAAGEAYGAVSLLISHRFSTARVADLIVLIENGRIVETGAHDELIQAGGAYAELYGLQARAYRD